MTVSAVAHHFKLVTIVKSQRLPKGALFPFLQDLFVNTVHNNRVLRPYCTFISMWLRNRAVKKYMVLFNSLLCACQELRERCVVI